MTLNRFVIQDPIAQTILKLLTRTPKIYLPDLYIQLRLGGFKDKAEIAETLKALDYTEKIAIQNAYVMRGARFRR